MSNYATIPSSTSLRLTVLAQRVHDLGPRPLYELMRQIVAGDGEPMALFEKYGALPAELIRAYRADTFSPNVILLRPSS
jgi:hypothetical protein